MRRVVRATVITFLLLMTVLSGCSAGQISQTATEVRDQNGGFGQVGDLTIREVRLPYPPSGVYQPGDQAQLVMAIVNGGQTDDRLVNITGPDFRGVTVNGASSPSAPSGTVSMTPTATPNPARTLAITGIAAVPAQGDVNIVIPANHAVFIGLGGPSVTLTGLTRRIDAAQSVPLTLTFARSGQTTVTAIVGTPSRVLHRAPAATF